MKEDVFFLTRRAPWRASAGGRQVQGPLGGGPQTPSLSEREPAKIHISGFIWHFAQTNLHPSWLFAHLVAEAVDGGVGAGEGALLDDGPEEPGEGGLLLVLPDLVHCGLLGNSGVRPDLGPVIDEKPGEECCQPSPPNTGCWLRRMCQLCL